MGKNVKETDTLAPDIVEKEEDEIDLLELALRLVEKMQFIIAIALVGALAMGIYSFFIATPIYESTSKLYVVNSGDSAINLSDLQIGNYLASDYKEVFNIWEVQEMVLQNLNLDYSYNTLKSMISVANKSNTRILDITAESNSAQEAMDLANEFAKVGSEYIAEMMETEKPNILSVALKPTSPVSPKKKQNVLLGFLGGAFVMCAYVFVQYLLDDKVKNPEDIRNTIGLAVLATVPNYADNSENDKKKKSSIWKDMDTQKKGGNRK